MKTVKKFVYQVGFNDNESRWQVGSKNRCEANESSHITFLFCQVQTRNLLIYATLIARLFTNSVVNVPDIGYDVDYNSKYAKTM